VPLNTDLSVQQNAEFIHKFIQNILHFNPKVKFILIGHSKGVVDVTAAMTYYPQLQNHVFCLVSLQAPYAGTPLVHDLVQTEHQSHIVSTLVEHFGGKYDAIADLSYDSRQKHINQYPFPVSRIPTISLATCDARQFTYFKKQELNSLLKPVIDFVNVRYGVCSDGCVVLEDAVIPGSFVVFLEDMDHFGPVYKGFPATAAYDPAHVVLVLLSVLADHVDLEKTEVKVDV